MSITIENPTAEAIYEALKQVPDIEKQRLLVMLEAMTPPIDQSTEWSEDDLQDFSDAGSTLYEEIEAEEVSRAPVR